MAHWWKIEGYYPPGPEGHSAELLQEAHAALQRTDCAFLRAPQITLLIDWDEIAADVAAGRAEQGSSPLSFRPGYGEVQGGPWIFYPSASDPEVGELTFWNAPSALDEFVDQAARLDLGGLFTWTATSDALDWRVHTRLRKRLDAPRRRSKWGVDRRVRTVAPRKNASVYPWHHVGGVK